MKNTPVHVCPETALLVDPQHEVGELALSIIIFENTLN
jgi:hypothetical protein